MKYTCDKCLRSFTKKYNYELHLKRKIPCKSNNNINTDLNNKNNIEVNKTVDNVENMLTNVDNVDNMLTNNKNKYECLICHKSYKERTGLFKHKKIHNNYEEEIKKNNESNNKNIVLNINDVNENIINIPITLLNNKDLDNKLENETVNNVTKCNQNVTECNQNVTKCNIQLKQKENEYESNVNQNIIKDSQQKTFNCIICNKLFKYSQSLSRHKKTHINYDEELQKITVGNKNDENILLLKNKLESTEKKLEQTEKKIEQLNEEYKSIIESKSKKSKIIKNANTTNNNTTNNTQNTLNNVTVNNNYIVNFGEEDLTKLTIDDKREILCSGSQIYPTLISKIYLNEKIPQNNCIRITNLRSDDMFIMEDGVFVSVNKKKTMEDLLSNMSIFAKRTFEEIIKSKEEIEQDENNTNGTQTQREQIEINNELVGISNTNASEQLELIKASANERTQGNNLSVSENYGLVGVCNTNETQGNNLNVSGNYGLVKVIKSNKTQNKIKKYKKPEIMLSEGQKENIKEQIMFIYKYDITGEDEDAEGVIKCTPINVKRYTQIKKDSEIKIYNFRNKINKNLIKN